MDEYFHWIPEGMAPDGLEDEVTNAGGGEAWAAKLFKKSVFDVA